MFYVALNYVTRQKIKTSRKVGWTNAKWYEGEGAGKAIYQHVKVLYFLQKFKLTLRVWTWIRVHEIVWYGVESWVLLKLAKAHKGLGTKSGTVTCRSYEPFPIVCVNWLDGVNDWCIWDSMLWTSKKMLTLRYMVEPKPNIPPYLSILTRLTSVLSRL